VRRLNIYIIGSLCLLAPVFAEDDAVVMGDFVLQEQVEGSTTYEGGVVDFKAGKALYRPQNKILELKDGVSFATDEGVTLTTDSANWNRSDDLVSSDDQVIITRREPPTTVTGTGIIASPGLKTATLQEDVTVTAEAEDGRRIIITCDGPLEVRHEEGIAVFSDNVQVTQTDTKMYADQATVTFDPKTQVLDTVVAEGQVRIVRGDDTTTAQRARYTASDKRIVLEGRPRLIIFQEKGEDIFQGMDADGRE
jgi:lipopolysaccharide transport protein LptA